MSIKFKIRDQKPVESDDVEMEVWVERDGKTAILFGRCAGGQKHAIVGIESGGRLYRFNAASQLDGICVDEYKRIEFAV